MAKIMTETNCAMTEMVTALDRWNGDGGAPAAPVDENSSASRQRLLLRLGIATAEEWDRFPTGVQRAIFRRAADGQGDAPPTSAEIARFLHDSAPRRDIDEPRIKGGNGTPAQT
ncbi:hypothetical protein [Zavarzinia sp.]|uniref:hypothetical protein n=1 Tax=Zavarzinia sp. TaxID=2027920 RepID=UPI0035653BFA